MGEGKIRAREAARLLAIVERLDKAAIAQAVTKTMSAITDLQGVDCLGYAIVGAGLLNRLGLPARAVAGHATWRVGPGDGDIVSHDPSAMATTTYRPAGQAGLFHAWIELDGPMGLDLIDLTTFQLRNKAVALDSTDGGQTRVDFCPPFLWFAARSCLPSARSVAVAEHAGVYTYRRNRDVESVVFAGKDDHLLDAAITASAIVYNKLLEKEEVHVIGVDTETGDHQTSPRTLLDEIEGRRKAGQSPRP